MPTEIYFRGGQQITVRESVDEVTGAVELAGPRPVPLTTYHGSRAFANWSNVLYVEDRDLPDPDAGLDS